MRFGRKLLFDIQLTDSLIYFYKIQLISTNPMCISKRCHNQSESTFFFFWFILKSICSLFSTIVAYK